MESLFALLARRPLATLSLLAVLCVGGFLASIPLPRTDNMLLGSDGVLYYQYVRSLIIDGDLDFANEDIRLRPDRAPPPASAARPPNHMPIGMGIVWIPFFLIGHGVAWLSGRATDGYGYIYETAVCLGGIVYGVVGMFAVYRLCREYADAASSVAAVGLIWCAGNLIYYMVAEPSMSHATSFGLVGVLLAWWRLYPQRSSTVYFVVLGALGGMAALVRPQDGLFLALPAVDWLIHAIRIVRGRNWGAARAHAGHGTALVLTAGLLYSIQVWAWAVSDPSLSSSRHLYQGYARFFWLSPALFPVLFSLYHGLFLWHPIYLVGVIGLWWLAQADRAYALLLAFAFALQVYVVSAWWGWTQGDSFGGRMFISTAPIAAVGLAQVVGRLRLRHPGWIVVPGLALIIWNLAFVVQYRAGLIPRGDPITVQQLVWDKFTLPVDLWRRLATR